MRTSTASISSTPPTCTRRASRSRWSASCSRVRAHDWILATKVGNKMSERPNESQYSRTWMLRACDASLQRLATDHIDIYYLHRDFNGMDLEEPLRGDRRAAARGQDPLLGRVELSRLAHRRGGAPGARAEHARARWCASRTTTCSTASPRSRCWRPARTTASAWCPTARSRAACWPASTRRAASRARGTRAGRGDPRIMETEFREESLRIAQTLKAHCERQGRVAGALRHRLGAGAHAPSVR